MRRQRKPRTLWRNPEASDPNIGAAVAGFKEVRTDTGSYFAGTLSLSWGQLWECGCTHHTAPPLAIRCAREYQASAGWTPPRVRPADPAQLALLTVDQVTDPCPF